MDDAGADVEVASAGTAPVKDLKSQAVGAIKWSALSRTLVQVIQFAGTITLAKLLTPQEFGLSALVLVVSNFALMISDLGLGSALVHSKVLSQRKLDTVFWLNAFSGFVMTAIVAGLAFPLAAFFGHHALVGLFLVSSLSCSLALTVVPLALLERNLNLRPAAIAEVLAGIAGVAAGIIAAILGAGAYAIVLVPLVNVTALSLLYLMATRFVPRGLMHKRELSEVWKYSRGLTGFNVINYFTRNSDDLLLGRFASPAGLGLYSRAFVIMLLPVQQIQLIIGRVLFPALTRIRDDRPKLVLAHRQSLVLSAAICAPLAAGIAACSHDFVLTFFGSQWTQMIPMIAILSSTGIQQVFQGTVGTLYQVTGRTDLMFRWNVLFTIFTLIAFVIGVHWGAIGMCWAVAVRGWLLLPITLYIPLRLIGDTVRNIARALRSVTLCLVIEAGAAFGTFVLTRDAISSPTARLTLEVLAGGSAYLIALGLLDRHTMAELVGLIVPRRLRSIPFVRRVGAHRSS